MATTPRPPVFADPAALMRVKDLELRARAVVEGFWKGLHRSARHGYSAEFAEYRSYVPGDDIRYLDWKVLARRDRYFIRKYREETNLRSHVLLDLSKSMNYGSGSYTKLDYARTLAATLAVFLHQQGDETGLVTFDEGVRDYLPPRQRSGHLHAILAALGREALGKVAALGAPIASILARGRGRGVVLLVSDFLTPLDELKGPLSSLAACGHDITLFQTLDPAEIHFTFDESADFEDMESGRSQMTDPPQIRDGYLKKFNAHQDGLRKLCGPLGIIHHLVATDQPLETALYSYLTDRQGLGPQVQRSRRNG